MGGVRQEEVRVGRRDLHLVAREAHLRHAVRHLLQLGVLISDLQEDADDGQAIRLVGGGAKRAVLLVEVDQVQLGGVPAAVHRVLRSALVLAAPVTVVLGQLVLPFQRAALDGRGARVEVDPPAVARVGQWLVLAGLVGDGERLVVDGAVGGGRLGLDVDGGLARTGAEWELLSPGGRTVLRTIAPVRHGEAGEVGSEGWLKSLLEVRGSTAQTAGPAAVFEAASAPRAVT